jgi:hypothetical protein
MTSLLIYGSFLLSIVVLVVLPPDLAWVAAIIQIPAWYLAGYDRGKNGEE